VAGGLGSLLVAPSRPSGFLLTLQQADGRHRAVAARETADWTRSRRGDSTVSERTKA